MPHGGGRPPLTHPRYASLQRGLASRNRATPLIAIRTPEGPDPRALRPFYRAGFSLTERRIAASNLTPVVRRSLDAPSAHY